LTAWWASQPRGPNKATRPSTSSQAFPNGSSAPGVRGRSVCTLPSGNPLLSPSYSILSNARMVMDALGIDRSDNRQLTTP
jgi:hypothetical protein